MRNIGTLESEQQALLAGAYLLSGGVECHVESGNEGKWIVWVLDEDNLNQGQKLLYEFVNEPDSDRIEQAQKKAQQMIAQAKKVREKPAPAQPVARSAWNAQFSGRALITGALSLICVFLWLMQTFNPDLLDFYGKWLYIRTDTQSLWDLLGQGQIWRIFTPSLMFYPVVDGTGETNFMAVLGILFGVLWLRDLGGLVERRENPLRMLIMVLLICGISNVLCYLVIGGTTITLFNVIYGLLGYLWIRGRYDRAYGVRLNPGILWFMLVWLGFLFMMVKFMVLADLFGLGCGCAWGYYCAMFSRKR